MAPQREVDPILPAVREDPLLAPDIEPLLALAAQEVSLACCVENMLFVGDAVTGCEPGTPRSMKRLYSGRGTKWLSWRSTPGVLHAFLLDQSRRLMQPVRHRGCA
jgi:hypothetical protein